MLSTLHRARQLERVLAEAGSAEVRELPARPRPVTLTADPDEAA